MAGELHQWLLEHAPLSDLDCYPQELLASFASHGDMLRRTVSWTAALPEDLFLHYVLFHRINNEEICDCRPMLYDLVWPRVHRMGIEDAILETNRFCHEYVTYEPQDLRTAPVTTVMRAGTARCGEESAFTVNALRAVGIAARQIYVPRWSHCDDQHAWVEAWDGQSWRFLGGCEPEPVLDRGCFNRSSSRAMLAHSRLFCQPDGPDVLDTHGCVTFFNQTARYALTRQSRVRVTKNGQPVSGAKVQFEVLNFAAFTPVVTLYTNQRGEAAVETGRGSMHVTAVYRGETAEGMLDDGGELQLALAPVKAQGFRSFYFKCPDEAPVNPIPAVDEEARTAELNRGTAIRDQRLADRFDEARAARFPDLLPLLRKARGNAAEILDFLERDSNPLRAQMLEALADKDLRDAKADMLEDHLRGAVDRQPEVPKDVYTACLLSPRIEWEVLTPWRLTLKEQPAGTAPEHIISWLDKRIKIQDGRVCGGLYWTPVHALRAGRCDMKSLRILTVALLRAKGIPARLSPMDGISVEYWQDGRFHSTDKRSLCPVEFEHGGMQFGVDWSVDCWTADNWQPIKAMVPQLPCGPLRVVVTRRHQDGSQDAAMAVIDLQPGQGRVELPLLSRAARGRGEGMEIWGLPGEEPTERALNELREAGAVEAQVLVPQGAASKGLDDLRQALPELVIRYIADHAAQLKQKAAHHGRDFQPPVVFVRDKDGQERFAGDGFNAGLVDRALRMNGQ